MENGRCRRARAAIVAASFVLAVAASAAEPFDASSAFDRLKSLEGTWTGTAGHGDGEGPASVVYHVVGGGSAVVETLFPGTPHEMVTVYHRDGERLVLTHYCTAGNQPRMRFEKSATPGEIAFAFDGGTNLKPERDGHMHQALIRVVDDDHIVSEWTYYAEGKPGSTAKFRLERKK